MDIDKTSLLDLNIFHPEEEFSIFHRLNFTRTVEGKEWLRLRFQEPFRDLKSIEQTQQILKLMLAQLDAWPLDITNGTLMVMEKFFSTQLDSIPHPAGWFNARFFKLFHHPDYAIIRFSLQHFGDFLRGMRKIIQLFEDKEMPANLQAILERARHLTGDKVLQGLANLERDQELTPYQVVHFGHYIRYRFRNATTELTEIYGKLDGWYGMAAAMKHFNLQFPLFEESEQPFIEARGLYHVLLPKPVDYDVYLDQKHNFLFLTGANMAGKSTFIKSVGAAVYLAHLGMGVPASYLRLSLFEGILSNINLSDNIVRGESYFFNEVQRIKNTILKINDGRKWLVLIDELFKGTNVQ
ncbi:MAG TPA: DNA mismatch repair protein MutS, partial [Flavihumibacter sp.]